MWFFGLFASEGGSASSSGVSDNSDVPDVDNEVFEEDVPDTRDTSEEVFDEGTEPMLAEKAAKKESDAMNDLPSSNPDAELAESTGDVNDTIGESFLRTALLGGRKNNGQKKRSNK